VILSNSKQKESAQFEDIRLRLQPHGESAVLVGADEDPDGFAIAELHGSPEERMARLIWTYYRHGDGCLRAQAVRTVKEYDLDEKGHCRMGKDSNIGKVFDRLKENGALDRMVDGATGRVTKNYKLKAEWAQRLGLENT
jgi:hypothetical protein